MNSDEILFHKTDIHAMEVSKGCLTIGTKQFPDGCVSLSPEETEAVLHLLLDAGLKPTSDENNS